MFQVRAGLCGQRVGIFYKPNTAGRECRAVVGQPIQLLDRKSSESYAFIEREMYINNRTVKYCRIHADGRRIADEQRHVRERVGQVIKFGERHIPVASPRRGKAHPRVIIIEPRARGKFFFVYELIGRKSDQQCDVHAQPSLTHYFLQKINHGPITGPERATKGRVHHKLHVRVYADTFKKYVAGRRRANHVLVILRYAADENLRRVRAVVAHQFITHLFIEYDEVIGKYPNAGAGRGLVPRIDKSYRRNTAKTGFAHQLRFGLVKKIRRDNDIRTMLFKIHRIGQGAHKRVIAPAHYFLDRRPRKRLIEQGPQKKMQGRWSRRALAHDRGLGAEKKKLESGKKSIQPLRAVRLNHGIRYARVVEFFFVIRNPLPALGNERHLHIRTRQKSRQNLRAQNIFRGHAFKNRNPNRFHAPRFLSKNSASSKSSGVSISREYSGGMMYGTMVSPYREFFSMSVARLIASTAGPLRA